MHGDLDCLGPDILWHISSWLTLVDVLVTRSVSSTWTDLPSHHVGACVISLSSSLARVITNHKVDTHNIKSLVVAAEPENIIDVNELVMRLSHAMQGLRALQICRSRNLKPSTLHHITKKLHDLEELHIVDTDGTWAEGVQYLPNLPKLRIVIFRCLAFPYDYSVPVFADLQHAKQITHLDLTGTHQRTQDVDLTWMATLPRLQVLRLEDTGVSNAAVLRFKDNRPNCDVKWGNHNHAWQAHPPPFITEDGAEEGNFSWARSTAQTSADEKGRKSAAWVKDTICELLEESKHQLAPGAMERRRAMQQKCLDDMF